MKQTILSIAVSFLFTQPVFAKEVLKNCFANGAEFSAHDLAEMAQEQETPVLLLSEKKEVVGYISVTPEYDTKKRLTSVRVNKLSLCSSLETDVFYYADDNAADLRAWVDNVVEITQDEGLIELEASVEKKENYATLVKVQFKAYDVFTDEEEIEKQKGQLDYLEDWGSPKGKGVFYFYLPAQWR